MEKFSKHPDAIAKLGTGEYLHNKEPGIYVDVVSGEPSFTRPIERANVSELRDQGGLRYGAYLDQVKEPR